MEEQKETINLEELISKKKLKEKNTPEPMKNDYFIRWFRDGKWQVINILDLTEKEFRQYVCRTLGLYGVRKKPEDY